MHEHTHGRTQELNDYKTRRGRDQDGIRLGHTDTCTHRGWESAPLFKDVYGCLCEGMLLRNNITHL